jgi:hypothetical protein
MTASWLSLIDYANKYKVSISTLRRKIKIEDIPFRLDSGKYYIVDEPLEIIGKSHGEQLVLEKPEAKGSNVGLEGESVLVAANRLLDEIKKAYTLILQEKDEQIRQLREEISDLKTLARVLEGENERLKKGSELYFD